MSKNTTSNTTKTKRKKPAGYHEAAFSAFKYLLNDHIKNGDVELFDEHRLSKRVLKIDIMVVKKNRDVEIEKTWGKIFREHNVIEYKSPVVPLPTLSVFNKVIHGYVGIYAEKENVKLTDMSATIVCFNKPAELFEQLEAELNYKILRKHKGIYYISQKGVPSNKSLAIQVVVSSELEDSDLALKALRNKLDEATAKKVAELPADEDAMSLWWDFMMMENGEILSQEVDMTKWKRLINSLEKRGMVTDIERGWKQEGIQEGRERATKKIFDLLEKGVSLPEAKRMVLAR